MPRTCWNCNKTGHMRQDCPLPKRKIAVLEGEQEVEGNQNYEDIADTEGSLSECELILTNPVNVIEGDIGTSIEINNIHGDSSLPQQWDPTIIPRHITDVKPLTVKPMSGKSYTTGQTCYATGLYKDRPIRL